MDIGEIKSRIAELEQRKAERNAMRGYRDVSYLDYIAGGDRSGFDRLANEENAYKNMLLQQKFNDQQRIANQKFQEHQKELDRALSLALAEKNKETSEAARMDENVRSRQKAQMTLDAAKETLAIAKSKGNQEDIVKANLYLNQAQADVDYWNKVTGYEPPAIVATPSEPAPVGETPALPQEPPALPQETPALPQETPETTVNEDVLLEKANGLSSKSDLKTMQSMLKQLETHPRRNQNKEFQSKINKLNELIKNKKQWLADEEFIKSWSEGKPFDTNKFKLNVSKGVVSLVRK